MIAESQRHGAYHITRAQAEKTQDAEIQKLSKAEAVARMQQHWMGGDGSS